MLWFGLGAALIIVIAAVVYLVAIDCIGYLTSSIQED